MLGPGRVAIVAPDTRLAVEHGFRGAMVLAS